MVKCLQFKDDGTCKEIDCKSKTFTKTITIPKEIYKPEYEALIKNLFMALNKYKDDRKDYLQNLPVDEDKISKLEYNVKQAHRQAIRWYGIRVSRDLLADDGGKLFIDIDSHNDPGDAPRSPRSDTDEEDDEEDDQVRYIKSEKGIIDSNTGRQQYKFYINDEQDANDVMAHLTSYYSIFNDTKSMMAKATVNAARLAATKFGVRRDSEDSATPPPRPRTRSPARRRPEAW